MIAAEISRSVYNDYHRTSIGMLPRAWNAIRLKQLTTKITDGEHITPKRSVKGYYLLSARNILDNAVSLEDVDYVEAEEYERIRKRCNPEWRDVLISCSGTIGRVAIVPENLHAVMVRSAALIKPNHAAIDYNFLKFSLQSQLVQQQILLSLNQGAQANLFLNHIEKLIIPCPPIPEQQRIAAILLSWDTAIDKTQKLIDQIKLRNKGLAQQLLTGKKRLKGFKGEWKKVSVGDVTENFSRRNNKLVDARIYSVTNSSGFVFQSDHFSREVAGEDLRSYKIIRKGEFAYNPARINVGSIAYFSEDAGIISSLYVCFRTNDLVEDEFLYYWLSLDKTKHDFETFGEGGVRIYLWYELFAKIKIMLPRVQEQRAIVALLRSAAEEISRHEERLIQLKDQKKGLMQKLLTGEIRVKIE